MRSTIEGPNRLAAALRALCIGLTLASGCGHKQAAPSVAEEELSAPTQSAKSSAQQQTQRGTSAAPPSGSEAQRIAKNWLDALRARDRQLLQKLSAVPFELHELVEYPKCEPTRAAKPEEVPSALSCLFDDQLLMEELAAQPDPVTEAVSLSELPAWAASLKANPLKGQLVQIRLPGDGVSYQFLLLATKAGVTRVWKYAEYDPD